MSYVFREPFIAFDEKNVPYGLTVEKNSVYTHNHVRRENGVFYITCAGNNFICAAPALMDFTLGMSFGFHYIEGGCGMRMLFGYDADRRIGHAVDMYFRNGKIHISLRRVNRNSDEVVSETEAGFDRGLDDLRLSAEVSDGNISGDISGTAFCFGLPGDYAGGRIGVTVLSSVGEMKLSDITIESRDAVESEIVSGWKTVTLSLRGGGTMPFTLSYSVVRIGDGEYLDYRFDGGSQYRERFPGYPRHTGQYFVERQTFVNPYVAVYDRKRSEKHKYSIYSGKFGVSDPGLAWKILYSHFNIEKLPISGRVPLPPGIDYSLADIAFGYETQYGKGFSMQIERDIEEVFGFASGSPVSAGKAEDREYIEVESRSEKTEKRIPKSVYGYGEVIDHLRKNHFFDESEDIVFSVRFRTSKSEAYIGVRAVLCDAYGGETDEMTPEGSGASVRFSHPPLRAGVYRIRIGVYYGDKLYQSREVVFEVCDPEGKKCPPLESGLPVLFSMPNEQKYLDRDAFDLYNPVPDCNLEHYYSLSSMPGDVGVKKRIWETNKLFGRGWYVWDSWHRTMTREEFGEYGEELIKRSDYCYYPVPLEWAVMRHDPLSMIGICGAGDNAAGIYGSGIIGYLHDFLRLHPEIDIGLDENSRQITQSQLGRFLSLCLNDWLTYANKRIREDFRKNTEWMRSLNPGIKRACYGPFNLYGGPVFTAHGCRYIGYEPEGSLAEYMFDGFAQLEDYPYSCAYHTYQGAFFVADAIMRNPGLKIYPEEYTASEGGCIDGAVKDAHPPIGVYDMQPYFNVTHSYEYVYNTAHLTNEGFGYWRDRGFMQRDFTEEFADAFVRGWKNVLDHEPDHPLRSAAYLTEIPDGEDVWNADQSCVSNRSNSGVAYVFETSRLCGLPNGFTVTYGSLMNLTNEMTDCVVLPSLKNAPREALAKIRELYDKGAALIAVSDVTGLEDIFGVTECRSEGEIYKLSADGSEEERIFPNKAEFIYKPDDAVTVLYADGDGRFPAVMRKGRALLINASVDKLGCQSYGIRAANYYAANISRLLRKTLSEEMRGTVSPTAVSDGCGITLLKDKNGETLLLAVNYSDYDLAAKDRTWDAEIRLFTDGVTDVIPIYGEKPALLKENGTVRGMAVKLHHQECALFALEKADR